MEDLPHSDITKIVGRQGVLWFWNLLRCSPGGDPELRFGTRLRRRLLPHSSEGQEEQENRAVFQRVPHLDKRSQVSEVNALSSERKHTIQRGFGPNSLKPSFVFLCFWGRARRCRSHSGPAAGGRCHSRPGQPEYDGPPGHHVASRVG